MTLAQVHGELAERGPIEMLAVDRPDLRAVYSQLMRHHRLGGPRLCGAQMRFGRMDPDAPCTVFFRVPGWKALYSWHHHTTQIPPSPPTLRDATQSIAINGR